MKLILAVKEDLIKVKELYEMVKGSYYCEWDDKYPTYDHINYDFKHKCLYVLKENDQVIGAISINHKNKLPNNYLIWLYTKKVAEIARLVVHPNYQNKDLAQYMVTEICFILSEMGKYCIHLIVSVNNLPGKKVFQKCHFRHCCDGNIGHENYHYFERRIAKVI